MSSRFSSLALVVSIAVGPSIALAAEVGGELRDPAQDPMPVERVGVLLEDRANLLDPKGDFWAPRRGPRTEIGFSFGPEGSLAELGGTEGLPQPTGINFTFSGRYYPVGRLAITAQLRNFFGLGGAAAGTGAATVISPMLGVRWDLVHEGRFSLLIDVYSGPAFFAFADFAGALESLTAKWAVGLEFGIALPLRYSLGPFTFELRPNAGLRAGSASDIGRPSGDVGPFSALYAGADLGITWSFWDVDHAVASSNTSAAPSYDD